MSNADKEEHPARGESVTARPPGRLGRRLLQAGGILAAAGVIVGWTAGHHGKREAVKRAKAEGYVRGVRHRLDAPAPAPPKLRVVRTKDAM